MTQQTKSKIKPITPRPRYFKEDNKIRIYQFHKNINCRLTTSPSHATNAHYFNTGFTSAKSSIHI